MLVNSSKEEPLSEVWCVCVCLMFLFHFMCVNTWLVCMTAHPRELRRDYQISPGTQVIDSCEVTCGFWELNPGPLQEQLMILTTESSLWP